MDSNGGVDIPGAARKMTSGRKRMSVSSMRSESPLVFHTAPNADSEEWTAAWRGVLAKGALFWFLCVCCSVSPQWEGMLRLSLMWETTERVAGECLWRGGTKGWDADGGAQISLIPRL